MAGSPRCMHNCESSEEEKQHLIDDTRAGDKQGMYFTKQGYRDPGVSVSCNNKCMCLKPVGVRILSLAADRINCLTIVV